MHIGYVKGIPKVFFSIPRAKDQVPNELFCFKVTRDEHSTRTRKETFFWLYIAIIKILKPDVGQGEWTNEIKVILNLSYNNLINLL